MRFFSLIGAVFFILGCQKKNISYDPFPTEETNAFQEVVLLSSQKMCTGTVISPKAILTAHHCVESYPIQVRSEYGHVEVERVVFWGASDTEKDLAIVILKETSFISSFPIARFVSEGDPVTLVGYGCHSIRNQIDGLGRKRVGQNEITRIADYIELETPSSPYTLMGPSNRAGSCPGDSGGPLLRSINQQSSVVGVAHSILMGGQEYTTRYVNLTSVAAQSFLQQVNAQYSLGIRFY